MTVLKASGADLCRITVAGPDRRADLAVPLSTTISALLPVLVRYTATEDGGDDGQWVLQRLGGTPFDPDETPETLDLLDGEQIYLRRSDDPVPELVFDDIADG